VNLPPGIDVPSPGADLPADVARDLRRIADRVGGWDRLRALVDRLAAEVR
jgi:hypothetical protein